jgi:hypothetical protein
MDKFNKCLSSFTVELHYMSSISKKVEHEEGCAVMATLKKEEDLNKELKDYFANPFSQLIKG